LDCLDLGDQLQRDDAETSSEAVSAGA